MTHAKGLYRMEDKHWARDVDGEKGNFDYLMGADVDVNDPLVRTELCLWGAWYADTTGCDGFRLDAVKHISAAFYRTGCRPSGRTRGGKCSPWANIGTTTHRRSPVTWTRSTMP